MTTKNIYRSVKVKLDTYRKLQHAALERDMTFTALIDLLLGKLSASKGGN